MYMNDKTSLAGYAGQSASSYSTADVPVSRVPELPLAVERLEKTLAVLAEVAGYVDNRLTGVVARANAPVPGETKAGVKPCMNTGLGGQLDSMNDRAQAVVAQLQSVLDRLEF